MIYTLKMIRKMGFNSSEEFAKDFIIKHGNCCIFIHTDGSVWATYDFDTQLGMDNLGINANCTFQKETIHRTETYPTSFE